MSRIRIVKGTYTKITHGNHIMYAKGNIISTAGGTIYEKGEEGGVVYGDYKDPPIPPDLYITMLVIYTPKDKGYNEAGELTDGLVYGKVYDVEAVLSTKNWNWTQVDQIKWYYEYTDGNGKKISNSIKNITTDKPEYGNKIKFTLPSIECCGNHITIKAVLNGQTSFIIPWAHYRFRWFSRKQVKDEIKDRIIFEKNIKGAFKIDQNGTSLCGIACIYYFLARYNPQSYQQLALELHQKGSAFLNKYTINPSTDMYDMNPVKHSRYPKQGKPMPYVDWITMASTRSSESNFGYKGEEGQDASAINWPNIMVKLEKELLDYTDVVDNTSFIMSPGGGDKLSYLIEMQKAWQEGYKVCVLIDSDMLHNKPTYFANFDRWHWIVYEGGLFVDEQNDAYKFTYFCWGELFESISFSKENFNSNYYGYIKAK